MRVNKIPPMQLYLQALFVHLCSPVQITESVRNIFKKAKFFIQNFLSFSFLFYFCFLSIWILFILLKTAQIQFLLNNKIKLKSVEHLLCANYWWDFININYDHVKLEVSYYLVMQMNRLFLRPLNSSSI